MNAFMSKGKTDPFAKSQAKPKTVVKKEPEKESEEPEKVEETKKEVKKPELKTKKGAKVKKETIPEAELDDDLRIDDFPNNADDEDDDFVATTKNKSKPKQETSTVSRSKSTGRQRKSSSDSKAKPPPKQESNSKKSRRKDSHELPAKKRRRIQAVSSSSSEGEEEEDEEMDIIPPSPPPVAEPVVEKEDKPEKDERIAQNGPKNKRMKKVLKSRTYQDEDGCMVTKKVYVFESCSSDEENVPANDNSEATTEAVEKKKKFPCVSTAAQKKPSKQSSLMGFFKKK